jgi:hypothetical protein
MMDTPSRLIVIYKHGGTCLWFNLQHDICFMSSETRKTWLGLGGSRTSFFGERFLEIFHKSEDCVAHKNFRTLFIITEKARVKERK